MHTGAIDHDLELTKAQTTGEKSPPCELNSETGYAASPSRRVRVAKGRGRRT